MGVYVTKQELMDIKLCMRYFRCTLCPKNKICFKGGTNGKNNQNNDKRVQDKRTWL